VTIALLLRRHENVNALSASVDSSVVATLLETVRRRSHAIGYRVAYAGSVVVILAGSYWFVERGFFPA